jgi:hypothetical protein
MDCTKSANDVKDSESDKRQRKSNEYNDEPTTVNNKEEVAMSDTEESDEIEEGDDAELYQEYTGMTFSLFPIAYCVCK